MPTIKAKKIVKKIMPFVPPIVKEKGAKIISNKIEKAPQRFQPMLKDEVRRVGSMKVK